MQPTLVHLLHVIALGHLLLTQAVVGADSQFARQPTGSQFDRRDHCSALQWQGPLANEHDYPNPPIRLGESELPDRTAPWPVPLVLRPYAFSIPSWEL